MKNTYKVLLTIKFLLIVFFYNGIGIAATETTIGGCSIDVVNINNGPICGKLVSTATGNKARAFLGINYAESTAGINRWQAPKKAKPWTSIRDSTHFGPVCPQIMTPPTAGKPPNLPQSEDCLLVNVWAPDNAKKGDSLAVMVFIHGGAFVKGGSSEPLYNGAYLAANKGVILVSLNYRLGVLGFLSTDELNGNYGFMDQQLALAWVKENIAQFGGDPDKVTLFGQSAGAMSISLHLLSAPASQDYFRAAIMESALLGLPYKTLEEQSNVGNIFKQGLNCRDLNCLKKTSIKKLLSIEQAFTRQMSLVFSGAKYYMPFTPVIDGQLITRQPVMGSLDKKINKPIMLGTTKNEAVLFVENRPITPLAYASWASSLYGIHFEKVIERYPSHNNNHNSALWARVQTDNFFTCSNRFVASNYPAPVFAYLFDHQPSFKVWGLSACREEKNVCHGDELPFVFHSAKSIGSRFTSQEKHLSNEIIDYWVNFAVHLHPAGINHQHQGETSWPEFIHKYKVYQVFDTPESLLQVDPHKTTCDFWDSIGYDLTLPWQL